MQSSLIETAYAEIRQRIVDGVYLPSQRLVEADLAQSLGVSRIIVRSALQRLHEKGLVTLALNRGATVKAVTLEEAVEVLQIREGLEGWAANLAAESITDEALDNLDRLDAEMWLQLRDEGRSREWAHLNSVFHRTIVETAGNQRLLQFMDDLNMVLVAYRFRSILTPHRDEESEREHAEIRQMLRSHSSSGAECAMRRHIASTRRTLVSAHCLVES